MEWLTITASLNAVWASVVPNTTLFLRFGATSLLLVRNIKHILTSRETQKQATDFSVVGELPTHKIHRIRLYHINRPAVKRNPPQRQTFLKTNGAYAE